MVRSGEQASRAYRSPVREQRGRDTRRRVLAAAAETFVACGWAGTTVRAVATLAGVSVPTVEVLFGTKARLLKAAIDVAVAGDDEPVPVLQRHWTDIVAAASTAAQLLDRATVVLAAAQERSAGLVLAVLEGSPADSELAALAREMVDQRAVTAGWVVNALVGVAPLRADLGRDEAVDTLWLLMDPAVFDRLTRRLHWSTERYRRWLAGSVLRLLTDAHADTPPEEIPMSDHALDPVRAAHGQLGFLQLPARDVAASLDFYSHVFGWSGEATHGSFEAPGVTGRWTTDRAPATTAGPLLWICADQLWPTLQRVEAYGGRVLGHPALDQGQRWLVEVDDPAGNRIGLVVAVEHPQPQPMVAVRDVEASSRWYAELLGLTSDHGGPEYERLLSGSTLVLQLHQRDVEHHHGRVVDAASVLGEGVAGSGVLVWFGEVVDLDGVVQRAERLGAEVLRGLHRNPPVGEGNGPSHRELWLRDLDGHTVVVASPDGEAYEPS